MSHEASTVHGDQSVEELRRGLAEAREQQAATSEILRVIGKTRTDIRPVFDPIITSAVRLCGARLGAVFRFDGELVHFVAQHNYPTKAIEILRRMYPRPPLADQVSGRAILTRSVAQIEDMLADPLYSREQALASEWRSVLGVPMLREGAPIGAIVIVRGEVGSFPEGHIELLKTFANQAVIAIENTRLFEEVQQKNAALNEANSQLTESLERQTATSEILGVISRSPTDVQPVFDTIVRNAATLCDGLYSALFQFDGELLHQVAEHNYTPEAFEAQRRIYPARLSRALFGTRAILDRAVVHVPDIEIDPEHQHKDVPRTIGIRSGLWVPMMRDSAPLGVIMVARDTPGPFSDREIELLKTFADQAVIAIENTRLFEAEQTRTRELTESLEQQTATSRILRTISGSPGMLEPVFAEILESAGKLCDAGFGHLLLFDGEIWQAAALQGVPHAYAEWWRGRRLVAAPETLLYRVQETRAGFQIADIVDGPDYDGYRARVPLAVAAVELGGARTLLGVPLLKEGKLIGAFFLYRKEIRRFDDKQMALLARFADQAVIAIENTRLFEEVQARNTELRVALEQQTATSELLKVIGRSTFELQPVFETLAENAVRLCTAERAFVHRFDGQFLRVVATHNVSPELRAFIEGNPMAPGRYGVAARAALERRTVHIEDVRADPEITFAARDIEPVRTALAVPMLRSGDMLGVIMIYRHEVSPFTESQVALIETFADQAAIAIENTRLLEELQARNRDLTAVGEVGRAVSSTLDLRVVLKTIVDRAVELSSTDGGSIFYFREGMGRFELGEATGLDEETIARYRKLDISTGQTGLGEAIAQRQPLQLMDVLNRPSNPLRDAAIEAGFRAALIVPLLSADAPLGALVLQRRQPGEFPHSVVSLMQSFADQSAIALENARLFEEIAQKSRELEIASQHKSQFVANMSHELRTPLAAILGYAELMQEGFYEPLGQKSMDALTRIRSNGRHLLGLINTVLDIAKIESGQFTLNMSEYAIESVVETVRAATESLAQTKKLTLTTTVDKSLPIGLGDEQRLTQVLLNLVGNAIKFTDAGEVSIAVGTRNGHFAVSVTDTGPGIPLDQQDRIFDQFHQVDSSLTKAKGGTGLGLAIAKQIVEMHGGRIWVESALGKGSTFQMEIPTRATSR